MINQAIQTHKHSQSSIINRACGKIVKMVEAKEVDLILCEKKSAQEGYMILKEKKQPFHARPSSFFFFMPTDDIGTSTLPMPVEY